jgi:hypothetical protein
MQLRAGVAAADAQRQVKVEDVPAKGGAAAERCAACLVCSVGYGCLVTCGAYAQLLFAEVEKVPAKGGDGDEHCAACWFVSSYILICWYGCLGMQKWLQRWTCLERAATEVSCAGFGLFC